MCCIGQTIRSKNRHTESHTENPKSLISSQTSADAQKLQKNEDMIIYITVFYYKCTTYFQPSQQLIQVMDLYNQ